VFAQTRGSVITTGSYQLFEQPDAHLSPVLHLIRSARKSLRLEVYLLTESSIVNELKSARSRGVDVRVLLEQHPYGAGRYAQLGYNKLQADGVPVRWANESAFTYTHEKSMEIDGTTAGIFTFNFSSSGFLHNREFGLIEQSSTDAKAIATVFDADWNRRSPHVSAPDLAISPSNSRHVFTALIDAARRTLDLYAEEVNDTSIEDHLAQAVKRGVRVRLIVSAGSSGVDAVRAAGVAVKLQPSPYVHAKAIVADGHTFFVGSENISATSLDNNREMGIVLDNATLAGFVEAAFTSDWGNRSPSQARSTPVSPPAHAGNFSVRVTASPQSLSRGNTLTIAAKTRSGAACTVQVIYPSHHASRARSVESQKTAGHSGTVSWTLVIGTSSKGAGTASVRCILNGASATGSASYQVV
jgi:phosphatidylserine/phosphatidylglycerophosphate/cardiolipin synthase-like enzyme